MLTVKEREKIREILEDYRGIPEKLWQKIPTQYHDSIPAIDDIRYHPTVGLEIYFIPLNVSEKIMPTVQEARNYLRADWLYRIDRILGNDPVKYKALAETWETLWKGGDC